MSGWISVEDEKPPYGECLVYVTDERGGKGAYHTANYRKNVTIVGSYFSFDMPPVTHWQPLPGPPK